MRWRVGAAAALLALAGCTAAPVQDPAPAPPPARAATPPVQTPNPASTINPADAMTWPVPDDELTPGLVTPGCTYPRDDDERDVTASTKRAAAARYHYTGPTGLQYLEYDHRIPFSLCGANTVANIWPEPADGVKQTAFVANRKDALESYAARQVRYHHWTLPYAQGVFRGDWRIAWCKYRTNYASAGVACPDATGGR